MKGIILAGGSGSRLYPLTACVSKQLLPVYDKPMVYYPLAALMSADIREFLLLSSPRDLPRYQELLSDGRALGISLSYLAQPRPEGIAQALTLAEDFLKGDSSALILGDNLFAGKELPRRLLSAAERVKKRGGAAVLGYRVPDPRRFGVAELNGRGEVVSLEEKPEAPKSDVCVTGCYFYDAEAPRYARGLSRSPRGEYEITDLNRVYLSRGELHCDLLEGCVWMDAGTPESLLRASLFIRSEQRRSGEKVGSPQETARKKGWIT